MLISYFYSNININGVFQIDPVFDGLPSGLHAVFVSDANGCKFEKTIEIPESVPMEVIVEDMELTCEESSVVLQPVVVSGNLSEIIWNWSDGSTEPWMLAENPGNYLVMLDDGCEVQEHTIAVDWSREQMNQDYFYIPDSFSPNYDGINDFF